VNVNSLTSFDTDMPFEYYTMVGASGARQGPIDGSGGSGARMRRAALRAARRRAAERAAAGRAAARRPAAGGVATSS
jgi:hypothetical protein